MHGIKCRFCGKEYFYDSKICRECEEYAIYSGLVKSEIFVENSGNKFDKWDCSGNLNKESLSTVKSRNKRIYFCITEEPRNFKPKNSTQYIWNSDSAIRFRTCLEELIEKSNLDLEHEIVDDFMNYLKMRTNLFLSYE